MSECGVFFQYIPYISCFLIPNLAIYGQRWVCETRNLSKMLLVKRNFFAPWSIVLLIPSGNLGIYSLQL